MIRKREQRFANVIARKLFAFEDQNTMAVFCENGRGGGSGWPAADDESIEIV